MFKLNFFYYNSQPDHSQLLEDTTIIDNETTIGECMEETAGESQQPLQEQRKTFVSPKKIASKRKNANDSDKMVIQNLQNIMQDISDRRQSKKQKNDNTLFGEFIVSKLEQFDDRMKTILQHQISTLIFNAELSYKFQPPTNQSQETSSSQIATSLPHLHSIYSIPPQSTAETYQASTSSSSMQSPYSALTPSPTHHSTFLTQPQSLDTYFSSSSSSPPLHSMSAALSQSPQPQYMPNNFTDNL